MDVDWQTDKHGYTEQEIGEIPCWIKTKQAENLQCGPLLESILIKVLLVICKDSPMIL